MVSLQESLVSTLKFEQTSLRCVEAAKVINYAGQAAGNDYMPSHSLHRLQYQCCGAKLAQRDETTHHTGSSIIVITLGAQDLVPVLAILQGLVAFANALVWQTRQILDHKLPIPLELVAELPVILSDANPGDDCNL